MKANNIPWDRAFVVMVAQGKSLVVLPFVEPTPSIKLLAQHGTMVALQVMGTWHWISEKHGSTIYHSALTANDLDRLSTTPHVPDRIDVFRSHTPRIREWFDLPK